VTTCEGYIGMDDAMIQEKKKIKNGEKMRCKTPAADGIKVPASQIG